MSVKWVKTANFFLIWKSGVRRALDMSATHECQTMPAYEILTEMSHGKREKGMTYVEGINVVGTITTWSSPGS